MARRDLLRGSRALSAFFGGREGVDADVGSMLVAEAIGDIRVIRDILASALGVKL